MENVVEVVEKKSVEKVEKNFCDRALGKLISFVEELIISLIMIVSEFCQIFGGMQDSA